MRCVSCFLLCAFLFYNRREGKFSFCSVIRNVHMKEINIFTFFCICFVYEMASEVPKKMIKIRFEGSFTVSLQTRFGLGGVIK